LSNIINSISYALRDKEYDSCGMSDEDKAGLLQTELIRICNSLGECNNLTDNKGVDIEYLLSIVGSYLIGIKDGTLEEDVKPPEKLFIESLYPNIKELEVVKEQLNDEAGEQSGEDTTTIEELDRPTDTP